MKTLTHSGGIITVTDAESGLVETVTTAHIAVITSTFFERKGTSNVVSKPVKASVTLHLSGGNKYEIDLQTISNQATWTPDVTGLNNAVTDISSWI